MTVRVSWLYPSPGTGGGQSREDTRLSPIGTMWPTGPTTTRSGLIPGGSPMALSGSGMTATIGLGRAVVQGTTAQGAYAAAVTAPHAVVLGNGHASLPRIDVIALRVYDTVYDATGQTIGDIVVVPGAANASPVVPAMPSPTTLPLYRITVPAGASAGGGGLVWGGATDMRVYTVSAGGILPADTTNANGSYIGQFRDSATGGLDRWDGAAWNPYPLRPGVGILKRQAGTLDVAHDLLTRIAGWDRVIARGGVTAINTSNASAAAGCSGLRADRAGLYHVAGVWTWVSNNNGQRAIQAIRTTSATGTSGEYLAGYSMAGSAAGQAGDSWGADVVMAAGDIIAVVAYQTSGVTIDSVAARLSIVRLDDA